VSTEAKLASPGGPRTKVEAPAAGLSGAARGGAVNLLGAGFSGLAGLAVTTLVARGLDTGAAGVFFAATAAFALTQMLAKLGTDTGQVYWVARLRAAGRPDLLARLRRIVLVPVLAAAVLAGVALFAAAPRLVHVSALTGGNVSGTRAGEFVVQLRVLAVFLPVAALSDALLSATRGYRTMRPTVLVEKVARPALQLAGLAAVAATAGLSAYTLAWVGPYLISMALAAWFLRRVDRRSTPSTQDGKALGVPGRLGRAFWGFTGPRAVSSVAQQALQRLDVLLVAALLGFGPAALYTVATRFIVVGQLGNAAVGSAVQPRLAELLAAGDTAGVRRLYQASTGWVVLLTWPLYLLVWVFAPAYLTAFGAGYAAGDAEGVVGVLCAAMLVATGCGMVDMVLTMGGRTTWNLANVAVALVVNVGLDLVLIPAWGVYGAAVGWAVAIAVNNLVPLAQIALVLRLHPFGRGTLLAGALAVGCFGVPGVLARVLSGVDGATARAGGIPVGMLAALGVTVLVGGSAYLGGCWLLRGRLGLDALVRLRGRRRAG
jgi:O-antigen/teichoic acid export membrane protein